MQKNQFIIIIDTAHHLNMFGRISTLFSRRRIQFESLQANMYLKDNTQRFVITINETQENAVKLSKQIEKQVDVFSVNLFEQTK